MKKGTQILILAFIGVVTVNTAKAQTYDPLAVQRINDLYVNNGLWVTGTPDDPETWWFATWNNESPKQIIELNFSKIHHIQLIGDASFAGLTTLQLLICYYGNLTGLDLSNCTALKELWCSGNSLTELDVTDCTQLNYLVCSENKLTELKVTNCTAMQTMYCYDNNLTALDLTGCYKLNTFNGSSQRRLNTLYENETGDYTCYISLNNPTFGNNAISYSSGILKSSNITVDYTSFSVKTNKEGFELSGKLLLNYYGVQMYDPYAVEVINNLIVNNGLNATPNLPQTWDFATWNYEMPKQIIELFFPSFYSGWPYSLSGDVSLAGLTALEKLTCFYSPKKSQMSNPEELTTLQNRTITKLNMANCVSLHTLDCRLNMGLTELDLTNCTNLQILECSYNNLSILDVTDCTQLETLDCSTNKLSALDLTGLDNLTYYNGEFQNVSLTLVKNEAEEYTRTITLNNPTFGNSAISYSDGILKSTDNTVTSTSFTVQTNKEGFELSGTMHFNYSTVGINTPDMEQWKIYPNPTTGVLHITGNRHCGLDPQSPENHEIAGQVRNDIKNIEIFDVMGKSVYVETHCRALQQQPTTILDISNLPIGIYFVKIITDTGIAVKKIVKQ